MVSQTGNIVILWSFTILSVLVLFSHNTEALDVEAGKEAILVCPLTIEYPEWTGPPNLANPLTNDSVINEDGFEWSEKKNLNLTNAQLIHSGEYKCTDGNTEGLVQLNVLSYNVSVVLLNTVDLPTVDGPKAAIKVTDGEDITAVCQVTGGSPAPTVTFEWRATNVTGFPDISNAVVSQEMVDDKTYTVNASVTFEGSQLVDNERIYCVATPQNADKNATESSTLVYVLFPPLLVGRDISQEPSLTAKQTRLKCDGFSKPETTFIWMADDQYLTDTSFNFQEDYSCKQNPERPHLTECGSNITISDLKMEDNGVVIKCIYVFERENDTIQDVYAINVPFEATEVSVEGNVSVAIGSTGEAEVSVTCSSNAANPAPVPMWYKGTKDGELLNTSSFPVNTMQEMYNGVNVTQTVDVTVDRTMDGSLVTCCVEVDDVCGSVTLDISYPPIVLSPTMSEYRAYIGDTISIPCIAESKPVAVIAWFKHDGTDYTMIGNNTQNNPSNILHLELSEISKNDSGTYQCRAWSESLGPQDADTKTTILTVLEKPTFPVVSVIEQENLPRVDITTDSVAPEIPRKFYIQYRRSSGEWLEIANPYSDTLPGQGETIYTYTFDQKELQPDTAYDVRVKSLDLYGLEAVSNARTFTTSNFGEPMVKEDSVSKREYRNAILISVFATAAVFLIILIVFACAVKKGRCQSSSSKSYVM